MTLISPRIRALLLTTHRWLGLHLCLFFGLVFLTGTLAEFGAELGAVTSPAVWIAPGGGGRTQSIGQIYDTLRRTLPQARVTSITKSPVTYLADAALVQTTWGESVRVWTDPVTGQTLDFTRGKNLEVWLADLHADLLSPRRVIQIGMRGSSVVLLVMLLTGMVIYRRFWLGLFKYPRRGLAGRGRALALHRIFAVWSLPFLLIMAVSAASFFIGNMGFHVAPTPIPDASPRAPNAMAHFSGADMDAATEAARAALSGFEPDTYLAPRNQQSGFRLLGAVRGSSPLAGPATVWIDPQTLTVLGMTGNVDQNARSRLTAALAMLHFGKWGGLASRLLWATFGFAATYLAFSGARIFVAETAPDSGSGLRRFLRGLGAFGWLYLAAALLVIMQMAWDIRAARFTWHDLHAAQGDTLAVRLQIQGVVRQGRPVRYRISASGAAVAGVAVAGPDPAAGGFTAAGGGGDLSGRFSIIAPAGDNALTVAVTATDGSETTLTYPVGQAIW